MFSTALCVVVCHGGPADHLATFIERLPQVQVEVYASGPALSAMQKHNVEVNHPFVIEGDEELLAEGIAKACSFASMVITDVGDQFDEKIQRAFARCAEHVKRFAYYDNPESYVPGGYADIAARVMDLAHVVLFANARLAVKDKDIGIGYYPLNQADILAERKKREQAYLRAAILQETLDQSQKILVYFGGNNDTYFTKAFPAFLSLIEEGMTCMDLTNSVIVLQQHPGAKQSGRDAQLLQTWKKEHQDDLRAPFVMISTLTSEEALIAADAALYYQTSMGPQFVLSGTPTIQIGHERYEDLLVKHEIVPSVTHVRALKEALSHLENPHDSMIRVEIERGLGVCDDWLDRLQEALEVAVQ